MPKKTVHKKYYYHITTLLGWLSINKNGITCSEDGYIYMLDTDMVANYVAVNQLLLADYGLFRIDPAGIKAELEPDLVAELTAKHQFRVKQELIEKKYIKGINMMHGVDPKTGLEPTYTTEQL